MAFMLGAIHSMVDVAGRTGHGHGSPGHGWDMGRLSARDAKAMEITYQSSNPVLKRVLEQK